MEKLIILCLLSLLIIGTVALADTSPQQSLKNALDQIAKFFPNDVIHVQISMNDGSTQSFTVITSGGQVTQFNAGVPANQTLEISSSQSVLEKIYSSSDQNAATMQALNNGGITITPVGFFNQVKVFFFKIYTTIMGLFNKG